MRHSHEDVGAVESQKASHKGMESIAPMRLSILDAVRRLKEESKKNPEHPVDINNIQDERVKAVYDMFVEWSKEIDRVASGEEHTEERLTLFLEQEMIMFDAGWVNDKEELKEIDAALDKKLVYAEGEHFIDLTKKIQEYKASVEAKML